MEKVVIDNVLEAIHYILEHNGYKFTDKQLSLADEYIIPAISELNISPKEFNYRNLGAPKLATDRRIVPTIIEYFAYIEGNISLYHELKDDGYVFTGNHLIKFYALDRLMTDNFKKSEYKNIVSKYDDGVAHFYYSIRGSDKEEKERYSRDFSDIVHKDQTTLKVGYSDVENSSHNYLIKKNFDLFGKEILLKANSKQRELINRLSSTMDEELASKITELITKYPNYSNFNISTDLICYLSADELNSLSMKDFILYDVALKVGLQERIRNILKLDPNFDCPSSFIREEIFRVLSDEEIVGLSDLGKQEILSIKIPEINNVLVMPIRKIKKVVAKDAKRNKSLDDGSIKK